MSEHKSDELTATGRHRVWNGEPLGSVVSQQQLGEINAKLVAVRTELAEKKARVDLLRTIEEKGGNVQSLPDLPQASTLSTLRAQETALSQKEADLSARYSDRHPLVVNVRAERRDIQRALKERDRD